METKWLEDFIVLAETRSFSRSAMMRNITQPAFSRRIQALEAWMGIDLIVRTSYPPTLTPAGEAFYAQAGELMGRIAALRMTEGTLVENDAQAIRLAMPHTLSLTFFPGWLTSLVAEIGSFSTQLRVGNVLDVVLWLVEGGCDLLVCYHHAQQPIQLDTERYDVLSLGSESLAPYSATDGRGRPRFSLPGKSDAPVPFLAYASSAYLGRMSEVALSHGRSRAHLRRVCETDMAEGLRQLALAGHGLAFLPESVAAADVASRRLVRLGGGWEVDMEIRAYRERPTLARPARRQVDQLWQLLESRHSRVPERGVSARRMSSSRKPASGRQAHPSPTKEQSS
jgi:DNA-binding transcriptional LysR family regulator